MSHPSDRVGEKAESQRSETAANVLEGVAIAEGVAVGPLYFLRNEILNVPRVKILSAVVDAEVERFRSAVHEAEEEFRQQSEQFSATFDGSEKRIFETQLQFFQDEFLLGGIEKRIRGETLNAEAAIKDHFDQYLRQLGELDSIFRERQADVRDVINRIQRVLLQREQAPLASGLEPFVLYARELLPSDTMSIDRSRLLGLVTERGGATSHVAILARAFDIPAVSGIPVLQERVRPGTTLAVDGRNGCVFLAPSSQQLQELEVTRQNVQAVRRRRQAFATHRARTEEEAGIQVQLNIENFEDVDPRLLEVTDGIGLYRTEFLFMGRATFPSEEEQYECYRAVLERAGDREVTIRTIDVGGDKPLPYLATPAEQNPALGWRGIRLTFEWPDLLIPQLRALIRASCHGRLRVLLPMVTHLEELRLVRGLYRQLVEDLRLSGQQIPAAPPLGVMIEVPAAAWAAADLLQEADFLSIGTNDLGQYFFAVDRNNLQVARFYQPLHPAWLRLLGTVIQAGQTHGKSVTVCGEMAGLTPSVLALLGLGLRRFSMSPSHVPEARLVFENFLPEEAEALMKAVLGERTEEAAARLLHAALDERLDGGATGSA